VFLTRLIYKDIKDLIIYFRRGKNHLRSCGCDDCRAYKFGKKRNAILKEALNIVEATTQNNKNCIFCGIDKDVYCVKGNDLCLCEACMEDIVIYRDWLKSKSLKEVM